MKVKIGETLYDPMDQPIMIILTDQDKKNIANMHPDCGRYCQFDSKKHTSEEIEQFMTE